MKVFSIHNSLIRFVILFVLYIQMQIKSYTQTAQVNFMHFSHGHTVTSLASSPCVSWCNLATLRCVKLVREQGAWLALEQGPRHQHD